MIRLSLKNILRKKSRVVLLLAVCFVAAYNIFAQMAQKNSVENNLKQLIGEAISGQFILFDSDEKINVLESQFSELNVFDWNEEDIAKLKSEFPGIEHISTRIRFGAMLSFEEENIGVNLQALNPDHLERVSSILEFAEGNVPSTNDEIMLSDTFADELETKVGDTIVVLANNRDGYLSDAVLKVSGVFKTSGLGQFLIPIGYIPYEKGKEIVGLYEGETMEVLVNFENLNDYAAKNIELESSFLAGEKGLKIANWSESSPLFNSIVQIWVSLGHAIRFIFVVFSVLIIINIVIMMTNNRKKEIGTMLALGYSPITVINSIATEYLTIIAVGVLVPGIIFKIICDTVLKGGILIPWEAMQAAYLSTYIFPEISWWNIISVTLYFCLACYLAIWISLRKLHRVEITSLLRVST